MYKQVATSYFQQTVDFLERVGDGVLLYVAGIGFTLLDGMLQVVWHTPCLSSPFSLYVHPDGTKALAWFAEEAKFGVLTLTDGNLSEFDLPFAFREDWFSNVHYWQGNEVFLYSAESDVVAVNILYHTMRHSRYEEAPLFGEIVETAYPRTRDFEMFRPPGIVTLYDEGDSCFLVHDLNARTLDVIPYAGERDEVILDHVGRTTVVSTAEDFRLYHEGREVFASPVCDRTELLKVLLMDASGRKVAVLSRCPQFRQHWLQMFDAE